MRSASIVMVAALASALVGCGSTYTLKGKVIQGDISFIAVVAQDDPRLEGAGVSGVAIELETDPDRLNKETIGEVVTAGDGSFSIGVDRVGAGLFRYDIGISAEKRGFEIARSQFNLPPSDRRVLVIMRKGVSGASSSSDDAWDDYKKFR